MPNECCCPAMLRRRMPVEHRGGNDFLTLRLAATRIRFRASVHGTTTFLPSAGAFTR
ncbi:peptide synthetase module [Anopheles sinensis]|uniref:Peptide synthetase module n=1 Tax=Anopheles sinensis TaxID=74873 RepID=A0A084VTD3_ANOSI|nr:peptide synthetase module [Anopheles sinensis]